MAGDEDKAEPQEEVAVPAAAGEEGEDGAKGEEEDTGAQVAAIVRLEEVAVSSGEEDEETLFDIKAKLYRFDKEWKERGVGQVKLQEHKETKKVRLLMRQQRTLKICANHLVNPSTQLQEHSGNEKALVWAAVDFADGEQKDELFTMRFGSVESAQKFKDAFEDAQERMRKVLGVTKEDEEAEEAADEAAEALESLKVAKDDGEKKEETA
eukprot:TRINITY_DN33141_c0_g1_i1.p1 TRINITY_DN33141_c0_g1~~TRINITY_DN33141_c0_g1_i1.p1  ORF type:complete len:210 (+),score=97.03 TRINITY_DN33141_c0_g1_i1:306-935(+)